VKSISILFFPPFPPLRKVEPNLLLYFFKSGKVVSKKGLVSYMLHL